MIGSSSASALSVYPVRLVLRRFLYTGLEETEILVELRPLGLRGVFSAILRTVVNLCVLLVEVLEFPYLRRRPSDAYSAHIMITASSADVVCVMLIENEDSVYI